jgi:hypothetical protein
MDKAKELAILKRTELDRRGYQWSDERGKADHPYPNEWNPGTYSLFYRLGWRYWKDQFYNDLYQRDDRLADLLFSKIQSKTNQTS